MKGEKGFRGSSPFQLLTFFYILKLKLLSEMNVFYISKERKSKNIMKMLKVKTGIIAAVLACSCMSPVATQAWDWNHILTGAAEAFSAATVSDDQIREYVSQYVAYSDKKNKIAPANSPYTQRLNKLTEGLTDVDGVPLNFKVYITKDVNAFACADGSVRVYSGLMDLMNDDEVLGVIGHEIGHVAHKDTKKAFKHALLTSAILDGVGGTSDIAAALTDSQLGELGQTLVSTNYSKKQESNADDYGYDFLKSHGKNPWAMAMAFTKLQKLEQQSAAADAPISQLFSDHPSTEKRIRHMEERAQKDHIAPPAGFAMQ